MKLILVRLIFGTLVSLSTGILLTACGGGGGDVKGAADATEASAHATETLSAVRLAASTGAGNTYYVDALGGYDLWSGKQSAATGSPPTNGPWQSLKPLAGRTFLPGDSILLKCGLSWHEPLVLRSSGTAGSPITIGNFPAACPNKPVIDGTVALPAKGWTVHTGSIYKAQLPVDLFSDKTQSSGVENWAVWSTNGDAKIASSTNCGTRAPPCLLATSGVSGRLSVYGSLFTLSPNFSYTLRFSAKAPLGVTYRALIRRNSHPWDTFGVDQAIVGTGDWAAYSFDFKPSTSAETALFNIEIPPGLVPLSLDDVTLTQNATSVLGVNVDGRAVSQAHHPNAGHDQTKPTSVYFNVLAASNTNVPPGSDYVTVGPDFNLGPNGSLQAGQKLLLRPAPWLVEERTVTGMTGSTLRFSPASSHTPQAGASFLLVGSLWMLDEPGEWHFDTVTKTLYIWMPDGQVPGKRVAVAAMVAGVDLTGQQYVTVDGLSIRGVGVGIVMSQTTGVAIKNSTISDTVSEGIDISAATAGLIDRNVIQRTGLDAISRKAPAALPNQMTITGNAIAQSAAATRATGQASLPAFSAAAIQTGIAGTVSGNTVEQTAYHGVRVHAGSTVTGNVIKNSCALLDDCAGIYVMGQDNNSTIAGNLVSDLVGTTAGTERALPLVAGIYLDELSSGVTVRGNTISNAEHGVLLHNANGNLIEDNKLYGNRSNQLWLSASTNTIRPRGDVFNNVVRTNQFFPSNAASAILQQTLLATTTDFATYDWNIYSSLLNTYIAREKSATSDRLFTLATWKGATDAGAARNLELNGRQVAQVGYTSSEITGSNILFNGDMSAGLLDWVTWSPTLPVGQMAVENVNGVRSIRLVGGEPYSMFYPRNFSVTAGQTYRLSFDMKVGTPNQRVTVALKRGGGGINGYELLSNGFQYLFGTTAWKRYTLTFTAVKSITFQDPVTGDTGARLEFRDVVRGEVINLANVELVPQRPVGTSLRTNILLNPTSMPLSVACPEVGASQTACSQYVDFSSGQSIVWPSSLNALATGIVYTRDPSIVDSDSDGIADLQDACPGTPIGTAANARGCGIGQ